MSAEKHLAVFILGGPGAGKGTQCCRIEQEFNFTHLSAGELLRLSRDSGSAEGLLIEEHMKEGKIVPVEITVKLMQQAMAASPAKKFLIDGFPRNEDNLSGWEKMMHDKVDVKFVLFIDCPEETCLERVMSRGKSSGRTDDNRESFVKRYRQYLDSTMPIVNKFKERGLLRTISGVPPSEEVFEKVKELFKDL